MTMANPIIKGLMGRFIKADVTAMDTITSSAAGTVQEDVLIKAPADSNLQTQIDAAAPGAVITLLKKEYEGPVRIDKPLVIEGHQATIWSLTGPVLTVASRDVVLKNIRVEVTSKPNDDEEGLAISITPEGALTTSDVVVRGNVKGNGLSDGSWGLPYSLELPDIPPRTDYAAKLILRAPVKCQIQSHVSGVSVTPVTLEPGLTEVVLHIDEMIDDTLIYGNLSVHTPDFVRTIAIRSYVHKMDNFTSINEMIWKPAEESPASASSTSSPPTTQPPTQPPTQPATQPAPPPSTPPTTQPRSEYALLPNAESESVEKKSTPVRKMNVVGDFLSSELANNENHAKKQDAIESKTATDQAGNVPSKRKIVKSVGPLFDK